MNIMPGRHQILEYMVEGYKKTGINLVGYDGNKYLSCNEIGGNFFIPEIAHYFGLPLDQAIITFYLSIILISFLLGLTGLFLLYKKWYQRLISFVFLTIISIISYYIGDIYIMYSSIVVAFIPFIIYFLQKEINYKYLLAFTFIIGILTTLSNSIRPQSALPVILFFLILIFFKKSIEPKKKIILIAILVAGSFLPVFYFNSLIAKRDAFLVKNVPDYTQTETNLSNQGAFWHSIYIGFGFLNNPYGINYKDEIAIAKVQSIKPGTYYLSNEYQNILKKEVFKLVKQHPQFVIRTIAAKTGVILFYFIICLGGIGVLLEFFYKKDLFLNIAFLISLIFSCIHGMAAIPIQNYLLGFIAFSFLYGTISINFAIENGLFKDVSLLLKGNND